jgi:RHS repeat-associated protein
VSGRSFVYNLRFPGQYYDAETGLSYNLHRDYDPAIGRYVESDPIGLDGGLNTYAYVGSMPTMRVDPQGLQSPAICLNPVNAPSCAAAGWISEAQAQAIEKAVEIARGLAAVATAISCHKDVDCEEWLELLNDEYLLIEVMEKLGRSVED